MNAAHLLLWACIIVQRLNHRCYAYACSTQYTVYSHYQVSIYFKNICMCMCARVRVHVWVRVSLCLCPSFCLWRAWLSSVSVCVGLCSSFPIRRLGKKNLLIMLSMSLHMSPHLLYSCISLSTIASDHLRSAHLGCQTGKMAQYLRVSTRSFGVQQNLTCDIIRNHTTLFRGKPERWRVFLSPRGWRACWRILKNVDKCWNFSKPCDGLCIRCNMISAERLKNDINMHQHWTWGTY